jgi:hypothetical protein
VLSIDDGNWSELTAGKMKKASQARRSQINFVGNKGMDAGAARHRASQIYVFALAFSFTWPSVISTEYSTFSQ